MSVKRIIAFIITIAVFSAILIPAAFGAFSPKESTKTIPLDILKEDLWTGEEGVNSIYKRTASGSDILSVSADPDAKKLSLYSEFEPIDISSCTELGMNVTVRGENSSYPVTVTLYGEGESAEFKETVSSERSRLYFPVSESIADSLSSIAVTVTSDDALITYVNISNITADNSFTYSYLNTFGATDFESEYTIKKSEDRVTVYSEEGVCSLSPLFSGLSDLGKDNDILVWIKLTGSAGGTVSAFTQYKNESEASASASQSSDKVTTKETPAQTVTSDGIYSFVVKEGFERIWFSFSALPKDATVTLTGAGFYDAGARPHTAGSITDCRYTDKKITLTGAISNDVAVKYNGAEILLFAIHSCSITDFDIEKAEPVASCAYSTKFTLSASMGADYWEYFYKVVLKTKDGFVPVGDVTCADSSGGTALASSSVFALHGSEAADAFEANASYVILDVCAGKLLENENINNAQLYSYKINYYFNRKYLSELDNDIRFYNSAGIHVYLRIYSDKDGYAFDYSTKDPDSLSLMCAVCSFLTERYGSNVQGYIMGPPVNQDNTGVTADVCEERAKLIAVFSETVKSKNPSAEIVISFSGNKSWDPQIYSSVLHYYLSKYGATPLLSLYEISSVSDGISSEASRLSLIPGAFSTAGSGVSILWNVPEKTVSGDIAESYRRICTEIQSANPRFVALSLAKTDRSEELYDSLKTMLDSENIFPVSLSLFSADSDTGESAALSSYAIWDFTASFNTFGWVSGGSFMLPASTKGNGGIRVLSAESDGDGGAGILIGKTQTGVDMTAMTARISLSVLSEASESAQISVLFGSGEARAEFYADVACNAPVSLLCDMTQYAGAGKIDYAAVIVRGVPDATAQIEKIELCSEDLSNDQLLQKYETATEAQRSPLIYVVIAVTGVVTAGIFLILVKKQHSKSKGENK